MATLIFVNGMPGVGKTSLLGKLSSDLGIGYVTKDSIKELLGDTLYVENESTNPPLYGLASAEALFATVAAFASSDKTMFVENAFWYDLATPRINRIVAGTDAVLLQIYVSCNYDEAKKRFERRREQGERHGIHQDGTYSQRNLEDNQQKYRELDMEGIKTYRVDTTHFDETDYQKLVTWLKLKTGGK